MTITRLATRAPLVLGRRLSGPELDLILKYLGILTKWNRIHRLVGSDDPDWLIDNVVLDSLLFLKVLPPNFSRLLDVGSGAGVPGIPLKIARYDIELVMVEARRKRASFLSAVIRELGLGGVTVVNARIESLGPGNIGSFDAITARCTSEPAALFSKSARFLSESGVAVASGPPAIRMVSSPAFQWVEVDNPVSTGMRRFAVMRSDTVRI